MRCVVIVRFYGRLWKEGLFLGKFSYGGEFCSQWIRKYIVCVCKVNVRYVKFYWILNSELFMFLMLKEMKRIVNICGKGEEVMKVLTKMKKLFRRCGSWIIIIFEICWKFCLLDLAILTRFLRLIFPPSTSMHYQEKNRKTKRQVGFDYVTLPAKVLRKSHETRHRLFRKTWLQD